MRKATITIGLAALCAAAGVAQQPGRMGGGGRRGGAGGGGRPAIDPVVLEGAPDPDFMIGRLELNDSQAVQYRQLRDSFMTATEPQRDSANNARRAMREAFQAGDRDTARQNAGTLRHLIDDLGQRQKEFDTTLKGLLNSGQWKAYQKWRDERKRQAEEERRQGMERPPDR